MRTKAEEGIEEEGEEEEEEEAKDEAIGMEASQG